MFCILFDLFPCSKIPIMSEISPAERRKAAQTLLVSLPGKLTKIAKWSQTAPMSKFPESPPHTFVSPSGDFCLSYPAQSCSAVKMENNAQGKEKESALLHFPPWKLPPPPELPGPILLVIEGRKQQMQRNPRWGWGVMINFVLQKEEKHWKG